MEIPKPKPPAIKKVEEQFNMLGHQTTQTTEDLKALGEAIKPNRAQGPRKPHLTHRPFVNPAVVTFRQGLERSAKIKKK